MTFSFYCDPLAGTNGGRFWRELCGLFERDSRYDESNPQVIYFNVSAPLWTLIWSRLIGRRIIVRLDGISHHRFTKGCLAMPSSFSNPVLRLVHVGFGRALFGLLYIVFGEAEGISEVFNLYWVNFRVLASAKLAHRVIYQSEFSRWLYSHYLQGKPSSVILNGARFSLSGEEVAEKSRRLSAPGPTRLVTVYDGRRSLKRLHDLLDFIEWANESRGADLHLTITGYDSRFLPPGLTKNHRCLIQSAPYVSTTGRFRGLDELRDIYNASHMFITFTYRDACPNVVVEAMALGLPVVGLDSGGVPELVGGAGEIVPLDGPEEPFFSNLDFGSGYPQFNREKALSAVRAVRAGYPNYLQRVAHRFASELDLSVVAESYLKVLETAE